ncbi:raffinose/stachyose/melibiose transport system permease protein [Streptosporangium becharense]|uniref:Raffinose/stachyose/melibiose transport system permease protein n=1 Tax=Streptosporangium becharense TaxID=1816182 RepID=A0A7W9IHS1_9ACTN|nr:sugar ABC transporter permease [Streptosporangium becharense]MBB2914657.1 raffinose/stachyose/melibiose transport system permease protein [Streptosporangium becharense]MBB5820942.1 raffinose/stachyose/melibiose transport system permease protein [Streptosporangium becharense]
MRAVFQRALGLAWVIPALALVGVFVYLPLVQNFGFSALEWDIYSGEQEFVGLKNYTKLLDDPIFWTSFGNNLLYAVISIVFQVFGALLLAALIESISSDRWRRNLRAIYFLPSAISLTVAGLLFYFIYEPNLGPLNHALKAVGLGEFTQAWLGQESTAMSAIIAMSQWQGFGYSTLLFAVAIQRIPSEIYGAAALDGTGPIRRFFHVTLPLVREMTGLMMMVTISGAFQVFNEVMVMTSGGPNNSTQVLGTWLYRSGFVRNNFGYAAAIATVLFVITLGIALAQMWVTRRRRVEW